MARVHPGEVNWGVIDLESAFLAVYYFSEAVPIFCFVSLVLLASGEEEDQTRPEGAGSGAPKPQAPPRESPERCTGAGGCRELPHEGAPGRSNPRPAASKQASYLESLLSSTKKKNSTSMRFRQLKLILRGAIATSNRNSAFLLEIQNGFLKFFFYFFVPFFFSFFSLFSPLFFSLFSSLFFSFFFSSATSKKCLSSLIGSYQTLHASN